MPRRRSAFCTTVARAYWSWDGLAGAHPPADVRQRVSTPGGRPLAQCQDSGSHVPTGASAQGRELSLRFWASRRHCAARVALRDAAAPRGGHCVSAHPSAHARSRREPLPRLRGARPIPGTASARDAVCAAPPPQTGRPWRAASAIRRRARRFGRGKARGHGLRAAGSATSVHVAEEAGRRTRPGARRVASSQQRPARPWRGPPQSRASNGAGPGFTLQGGVDTLPLRHGTRRPSAHSRLVANDT